MSAGWIFAERGVSYGFLVSSRLPIKIINTFNIQCVISYDRDFLRRFQEADVVFYKVLM